MFREGSVLEQCNPIRRVLLRGYDLPINTLIIPNTKANFSSTEKNLSYTTIPKEDHDESAEELCEWLSHNHSDPAPVQVVVDIMAVIELARGPVNGRKLWESDEYFVILKLRNMHTLQ